VKDIARFIAGFERFQEKCFTEEGGLLEFAVLSLKVEHSFILDHARCGGIHALLHYDPACNAFEEARPSQQPAPGVSA